MAVGEKDKWSGMFYHDVLALREGASKLTIFLKPIIANANITFIYKII